MKVVTRQKKKTQKNRAEIDAVIRSAAGLESCVPFIAETMASLAQYSAWMKKKTHAQRLSKGRRRLSEHLRFFFFIKKKVAMKGGGREAGASDASFISVCHGLRRRSKGIKNTSVTLTRWVTCSFITLNTGEEAFILVSPT